MSNMETITYACPHCGRTWLAKTKSPGSHTGWTGFLSSNVSTHRSRCIHMTPQERHAQALRDERRWERYPPKNTVCTIHWTHPGMLTAEQREQRDAGRAKMLAALRSLVTERSTLSVWAASWLERLERATDPIENDRQWDAFSTELSVMAERIQEVGQLVFQRITEISNHFTVFAAAIQTQMESVGKAIIAAFTQLAEGASK